MRNCRDRIKAEAPGPPDLAFPVLYWECDRIIYCWKSKIKPMEEHTPSQARWFEFVCGNYSSFWQSLMSLSMLTAKLLLANQCLAFWLMTTSGGTTRSQNAVSMVTGRCHASGSKGHFTFYSLAMQWQSWSQCASVLENNGLWPQVLGHIQG